VSIAEKQVLNWQAKCNEFERKAKEADARVISCVEALRLHQSEAVLLEEDLLSCR